MALLTASLGYPGIGMADAVRRYRDGALSAWGLYEAGKQVRGAAWATQRAAGIDIIPSGDIVYTDQALATAIIVGAVPARFGDDIGRVTLDEEFAMADGPAALGRGLWFGTGVEYAVPEFGDDCRWRLGSACPVADQLEAISAGVDPRPVMVGPISLMAAAGANAAAYVDKLQPAYTEVVAQLGRHGASWVQLEEPALAQGADGALLDAAADIYTAIKAAAPDVKLMLVTWGGAVTDKVEMLAGLPIDGLHVDLVASPDQADRVADGWPASRVLSAGVLDALSPGRVDLAAAADRISALVRARGEDGVQVAPSLPLRFAPVTPERAILSEAPNVATAAVKLRGLRKIANLVGGVEAATALGPLPDRRDLAIGNLRDAVGFG